MNVDTLLCVGLVAIAAVMIGRMGFALRRQRYAATAAQRAPRGDPPRARLVRWG
jgi:hypothetical protein